MTIYERDPLFSFLGFGIGKRERVAEIEKIINSIEGPDLQDDPRGSWHGHYFYVIDSDTISVGRLENILDNKMGDNLELSFRMVRGYKLHREQINENPVCKGKVRWEP